MSKQLLRFALSRIDVLDSQTLDLENLDFALGRNTVLEFRDVGLILQVTSLTVLFRPKSTAYLMSDLFFAVETREASRATSDLLPTKG